MKVLLHADSLIRDAGPCLVLSEILKSQGHDVVVSSRLSIHIYIKLWQPDYLLHSNPSAVSALIKTGLIKKSNLLVGILPQEGMESHPETIRSFYEELLHYDNSSYLHSIFIWNQYQKEWLLSNSELNSSQIEVTGNARLDLSKYGQNKKFKTKRIGFIGRFPTLNKYDGSRNLMNFAMTVHEERSGRSRMNRLNDACKQLATATIYGEIINHILKNTDYIVSLRPHHDEASRNEAFLKLRRQFPERFEVDRGLSIYDWATSLDVIVSTVSTTFAEAYLARTPVIATDMLIANAGWADEDEKTILDSYDANLMPQSLDDCFRLIEECMSGNHAVTKTKSVDDALAKTFSWPYEGSGLKHIANQINSLTPATRKMGFKLNSILLELIALIFHFFRLKLNLNEIRDKHYFSIINKVPSNFVALAERINKST
jgi:surface carbohydrate biosynthesis protein